MKIAIVNDLIIAVEALRRVIQASGLHEVCWVAYDGREAVDNCKITRPDLILMDLYMPVMDGIDAIRHIMAATPCAILIVTATPEDSTGGVFRAMGAGALDVTATPILSGGRDGGDLMKKIATIRKLVRGESIASPSPAPVAPPIVERRRPHLAAASVIGIGASTGGPVVIVDVLNAIGTIPNTAVVIVQHIDSRFVDGFVHWLSTQISQPVDLIEEGDSPEPGRVQVGRAHAHLLLDARGHYAYDTHPVDYPYRPSVDVFFHSIAHHRHAKSIGVLLTGMGRDGAEGLLAMRQAGHLTLTQDQASCAVYGMPRAAVQLGAADFSLAPHEIGLLLRDKLNQI